MATKSFVRTEDSGKIRRFTWVGLLNGDDGVPISVPGAADMTVQAIQVVAGVGDTVILEGSCQEGPPTVFFQMRDGGDNLISFTGSDGELVAPMAVFIRPRITNGDVDTNFTVILIARSTMR